MMASFLITKNFFSGKGLVSGGKRKYLSWAGAVNEDFIQSVTCIVFCYTLEELGEELQCNFTKDPTLHKTSRYGAVAPCRSPKERFGSGTTSLTNTKCLHWNAASLHNQKPSVSWTPQQQRQERVIYTLWARYQFAGCYSVVWLSSTKSTRSAPQPAVACICVL